MNSRTDVLNYIVTWIYENTGKEITGTIMQAVLSYMADREYQPSEIPVSKAGYTATDLDAILTEIIANIDGVSAMTPEEIVTALETLSGGARLSGAKVDYDGSNSVTGLIGTLVTRLSLTWSSETNYGLGHVVYNDGALYISASASNTNHEPPNASYWTLISTDMTAAEIATLLNANTTLSQMLKANRVQLESEGITVKAKFTAVDASIATKQNIISTYRDIYGVLVDDTPHYDFPFGGATILQMSVNRVPMQGIEASSFSGGAGAYDFRYYHNTALGVTSIYINPSMPFDFEDRDIIDIIYY